MGIGLLTVLSFVLWISTFLILVYLDILLVRRGFWKFVKAILGKFLSFIGGMFFDENERGIFHFILMWVALLITIVIIDYFK